MGGQFKYCLPCRRNHNEGKKHLFTRAHQSKVEKVLNYYIERIKELKYYLTHVSVRHSSTQCLQPFECTFCDKNIEDTGDFIAFVYKQH